MGDFYITALSDVNCPILIHPEWSYRDKETMILSRHRTQTGNLYSYIWGRYLQFQIPLRFVNSSDQSRINNWWEDQEDIAITLNSSESVSTVLCKIVNKTKPIDKFTMPYNNLFEGDIKLETFQENGTTKYRRPFILDDDISGLLDQDYNALTG